MELSATASTVYQNTTNHFLNTMTRVIKSMTNPRTIQDRLIMERAPDTEPEPDRVKHMRMSGSAEGPHGAKGRSLQPETFFHGLHTANHTDGSDQCTRMATNHRHLTPPARSQRPYQALQILAAMSSRASFWVALHCTGYTHSQFTPELATKSCFLQTKKSMKSEDRD